jgi:DNA-binding transcriptional MerR regulator
MTDSDGDDIRMLTIGPVAKRLGVSRSTIREWEAVGRLPRSLRLESDGPYSGLRVWRREQIEAIAQARNRTGPDPSLSR